MAIDKDDLLKLTAEYEAWIASAEYKALALPKADTEEGKNKHREAFLQYMSEAGKSYPTFDPRNDEADNLTALNAMIEKKSNPGFLDKILGFLGDNKFGLGAAVLTLIATIATGTGGLISAVLAGGAFLAGSYMGDSEGLLSGMTGSDKPKAPSNIRFIEGDAADLPLMANLKAIGEVKNFEHHAEFRDLIPADNKPTRETNMSATVKIEGQDVVVYGTKVGNHMHVTHLSLGTSRDGHTIIQPLPEGVGDVKLEIVGRQLHIEEESARAVAKAHDQLVSIAQGKPQVSDLVVPVKATERTRALNEGERIILQIKNDKDEVVGMVQGNVIKTASGLKFKAIASEGFKTDDEAVVDPNKPLTSLRNYVEIPLGSDGTLEMPGLMNLLREQRKQEKMGTIDESRMALHLNVATVTTETRDNITTITGKYENEIPFSVLGFTDPTGSGIQTMKTGEKDFEIQGRIDGPEDARKLTIAAGSKIKLKGVELTTGDKDIVIDLGNINLETQEGQAALAEKLKGNLAIKRLMQLNVDPTTGQSLADKGGLNPADLRRLNLNNPDLIQGGAGMNHLA